MLAALELAREIEAIDSGSLKLPWLRIANLNFS